MSEPTATESESKATKHALVCDKLRSAVDALQAAIAAAAHDGDERLVMFLRPAASVVSRLHEERANNVMAPSSVV